MKKHRRRLTAGGPDFANGEAVSIHHLPFQGCYAVRADLRSYAYPQHFHDEYHITILLQGAQGSRGVRNVHEVQQVGEVKFAEPGEVHDGIPVNDHARSYWTLYLDQTVFSSLVEDIGLSNWHPAMIRDRDLFRVLLSMFGMIARGEDALAVETKLIEAITGIGRSTASYPKRPPRGLPIGLSHAQRMIDDDPATPFSLADLATASGLTKPQIVHGFQRLLGIPPHTYQIQRRTALAMKFIRSGNSLADAAVAAGFSDQAHMTRTFRAVFGATPRAFQPPSAQPIEDCAQCGSTKSG